MNAQQIIDFYVASQINESAEVLAEGDYSALVLWDSPVPNRPNRQSRPIRIELGRAFVDDFNAMAEDQQEDAGDRLAATVTAALDGYDERSDEKAPYLVHP